MNALKAVPDGGIPTVVTSHCRYLFPAPASNGCNARKERTTVEMKAVRGVGERRQGILLQFEKREKPCIFFNSLSNTWLGMVKWGGWIEGGGWETKLLLAKE